MQPHDAGVLATRIVALYFGIQAFIQLVNYFAFQAKPFSASARFLLPIGALALIAAVLWWRAERIGAAIARGSTGGSSEPRPVQHLRAVAAFILGLVLAGLAIPAIVSASVSDLAGAPVFGIFVPFGGRSAAIATAITQLIVGIALMGWAESQMPRKPGGPDRHPR
jgi:hypothetical protein